MNRIRRALLIFKYGNDYYTLTRFSWPNCPLIVNAGFNPMFLHYFFLET